MRLHVVSWTAVLHYIYIIVAYIPYLACNDAIYAIASYVVLDAHYNSIIAFLWLVR